MTGQELRDYIVRDFKRTDKNTELYDGITDTLNEMRDRFEFEDDKKESAILTISVLGEYTIDLPADFGTLIGDVRFSDNNGDEYTLIKISKPVYDDWFPDQDYSQVTTAKPIYYCIYNNKIYLANVPDSTTYQYEINYSLNDLLQVTSITDPVPFSDKYRELLKFGTLKRLFFGLGDEVEGTKYFRLYEDMLSIAISKEKQNTTALGTIKYRGF